MKTDLNKLLDEGILPHDLPMSDLEKQLKRSKQKNASYHDHVLTPKEMTDYIFRLSTHFAGKKDYRFPENDILLIGGNIAQVGSELMQQTSMSHLFKEVADLFQSPAETNFFSEVQSISAGRFLRHMPAYWQDCDYFEIYYVFSGECPIWFEGEEITLAPGSVLLIPPGVLRACCFPFDDCVVFFYKIRSSTFSRIFREQLSSQNLMSLFFLHALERKSETDYLRFETSCNVTIELLLYAIFQEYAANDAYSIQMTNSLMNTFFAYLLQNYEQTATVSKNSKIAWKPEFARMFSYIQEHYQSVTLQELSQVFHYSQRQIIRIIQNSTAKTFSQLLTQLRMEKAAALLFAKNVTTEQVAEEVGYASLSSFYRVFSGYYGMPPGQWREHNPAWKNNAIDFPTADFDL